MKQILKNTAGWINKYKIFLLFILIGLGLFYWYSFRPSLIKRDCFNVAVEKAREKRRDTGATDGKFSKEDYDTYYRWCLQKKGL